MRFSVPKYWEKETYKIDATTYTDGHYERVFVGLIKTDIDGAKELAMEIFGLFNCSLVCISSDNTDHHLEYSAATKQWKSYKNVTA